MSSKKKYFGTDGIRGVVGQYPITPDFALRLGYAVGRVLADKFAKPAVIIGKDTRVSGYIFESSLEAGFSYAGVDVYMAGPVPTPAVAYLTSALHLSAGVVISASHNPYTDNGIKFFSNHGTKLADELETQIESYLETNMEFIDPLGKVVRLEDTKGRYIEFCKNTFPKDIDLTGFKIVIDCANGATYQIAPSVFKELGAEVIKIACEPNGVNINDKCGSTHESNIIKAVKEHKADLGIAFDGDGDRVLFVDNNGVLYNGDKLIYAILKSYITEGKKIHGIVGTVMTNLAMEHALTKNSCELVRAKVGDRYVLEEMQKRGWIIGGEASGHILCLDKHSTGDGIISALQVLVAIIKLKQPLKDIIDWNDYPQSMINIKLDQKDNSWQGRAKALIDEATSVLGGDGRVVVRASGTEPLVRVMVEAKSNDLAILWASKIAGSIKL
ncbi:MAG: phosphoglucosamine mutase [Burkholderiales bacterium]|nr:phosphoglucosamine mutase [Burkholderiales bacterium]